nr:peptidyl-prolyl cis-trans isomerase G [Ciona intestinalis]|eukprot:XP_018668209.2 peptidyl-prolyl cis-trans isomerase G [Ciona intestinalis]
MRRAEPAGYQKDYGYERQPGDGLNNELNNQPIVRKQSPPRKPMRNSIKNNSEVPDQGNPPQPANENHPLSHAHSKDRLRVAKGMPSRKPPTRQSSSGNLINVDDDNDDNTDYEITVTTNDLRHVRQSPITVQQTNITTPPKVKGHEGSKVKRLTKDEVKVKEDKKLSEQKSKIVFKVPDPNATKPTPLPDITEPVNNKKQPPTYTGNSPPKPKQSIGSDLLGQFKSARENAVRSAAKKQDRALKSVVALTRMGRTPSPTKKKPQPENLPDKNADRIINSKSTKNHEIYEKSKPKANRASPVESSRTSVLSSSTVTGRKEESDGSGRRERRDDRRGRSHGRSRDDHDRRDHGSPSRRRGRSRSRDREIEPRERSRERELDRDERARKSQRDIYHRAVSPYKHHPEDPPYPRREPPYPRSRDPRSDEPDWVEEFRRRRANDDDHVTRRAWVNDPRWKDKRREFDINEYERDVRKATSYNSDFEQPQRKQMFPSKLMAKGNPPPGRKHPGGNPRGNNDWMRDLKENNKKAAKNRFR